MIVLVSMPTTSPYILTPAPNTITNERFISLVDKLSRLTTNQGSWSMVSGFDFVDNTDHIIFAKSHMTMDSYLPVGAWFGDGSILPQQWSSIHHTPQAEQPQARHSAHKLPGQRQATWNSARGSWGLLADARSRKSRRSVLQFDMGDFESWQHRATEFWIIY